MSYLTSLSCRFFRFNRVRWFLPHRGGCKDWMDDPWEKVSPWAQRLSSLRGFREHRKTDTCVFQETWLRAPARTEGISSAPESSSSGAIALLSAVLRSLAPCFFLKIWPPYLGASPAFFRGWRKLPLHLISWLVWFATPWLCAHGGPSFAIGATGICSRDIDWGAGW